MGKLDGTIALVTGGNRGIDLATAKQFVNEGAYVSPDIPLLDVSDGLTDFAATAALLSTLDLVISIDTGALNLAGALGVPAWLLNYHGSDRRWGISGDRSPWYPDIRIFRKSEMGEWRPVIAALTQALVGDRGEACVDTWLMSMYKADARGSAR